MSLARGPMRFALTHSAPAVAVRATNLALLDFLDQSLQAASAASQRHDVVLFLSNVVEVEHADVLQPAVDATGGLQAGVRVDEVAGDRVLERTWRFPPIRRRTPRACPASCAATVAVNTHNLAPSNLCREGRWRVAGACEEAEIAPLLA